VVPHRGKPGFIEKGSASALARCWPSNLENVRWLKKLGRFKEEVAARPSYGACSRKQTPQPSGPALAGPASRLGRTRFCSQHQTAFGLTAEDLDLVIEDMARSGQGGPPTGMAMKHPPGGALTPSPTPPLRPLQAAFCQVPIAENSAPRREL